MIKGLNFRTLDLNLLRVFDEVMAERNLTRAAHNLAMTQPAVSNALRRLREVVGDELVHRAGYGVEPTPVALALWPSVREALALLRETLSPDTFDPARAQSSFVLAMADATAAKIVPSLVRIGEQEAPGVSLRVLPLTTRDPRSLLESGSADVAIGHFPGVVAELGAQHLKEENPAFLSQRLYDGEYVVVMRRDHPLAGRPLTLDDFCAARHLLVSFSGRPFGFVDEALTAVSRQRRVVLTVNQGCLDTNGWEAGENTDLHGVLDSGVNGWDVFTRNTTTGNSVLELVVSLAGDLHRFDGDLNLSELT